MMSNGIFVLCLIVKAEINRRVRTEYSCSHTKSDSSAEMKVFLFIFITPHLFCLHWFVLQQNNDGIVEASAPPVASSTGSLHCTRAAQCDSISLLEWSESKAGEGCCVSVRSLRHETGSCGVTQTAAAKKLNRAQLQAQEESALKVVGGCVASSWTAGARVENEREQLHVRCSAGFGVNAAEDDVHQRGRAAMKGCRG